MKKLSELKKQVNGKTVLLRTDFNVPIAKGKVVDDFRITQALATITTLTKAGAKVIIVSHIGEDGDETLKPVSELLQKTITHTFIPAVLGFKVSEAISRMEPGDVILLENLRQNPGEVGNDREFAVALASLAEFYVNDAFSVCHREHASIVGVPKLIPGFAGLQLEREIKNLSVAFKPPRPFLFMLGGAKFSTKLPLIKTYLKKADAVFVGGALANTLLKAAGDEVGKSLYEEPTQETIEILKSKTLALPIDVTIEHEKKIKMLEEVSHSDKIMDIGPETINIIKKVIDSAHCVVWNGPFGVYEKGFDVSTKELLRYLASKKDKTVIIGGGDTDEVIAELGLRDAFTFVSTGGGATLAFLSEGTLPGILALK